MGRTHQVTLKLLEVPGVPSCSAQPCLQTVELAWPGGCTGKPCFKSIFPFAGAAPGPGVVELVGVACTRSPN